MGIAAGVAFVLSWILGVKTGEDEPASAGQALEEASAAPQVSEAAPAESGLDVCAPITGKAVPLTETGDETFASGVLGQGAAIIPAEGKAVAPFAATVAAVMGHAVALEGNGGVELLIHVGVNTVELNGKYYTPHVKEGDRVAPARRCSNLTFRPFRRPGTRSSRR